MSFSGKVASLILVLLILCSCSMGTKTSVPESQVTPRLETPAQPFTPSPSPAELIPSITPPLPPATSTRMPATITHTPAPLGLNPSGPYVLFFGHSGVWISNPDGSFLTQLSTYELSSPSDMHKYLSPQGDQLAMVTSNEKGLDLVLLKIPTGETETITHLIDSPAPENFDPTSPNAFATYAIRDYDSVAWQPGDGRLLAFVGASNGPTADLYLYNTETKKIEQLTKGPSQAVMPAWSPDGQYILRFGVSWVPPFGGAILGANRFDGVWAVRSADGKVITLPKNEGSVPNFIGWQDDTHYITYDPGECSANNLRSVDVTDGKSTPLMEASFYYYIAQSPINGNILFSSAEGCANSLGEGIFLLTKSQVDPIQLFNKRAWEINWMPESGLFEAYPEGLFTSDGLTHLDVPVYDKSYKPAVSKHGDQAWEVLENFQGRVVVKASGEDWRTIYTGIVDGLIWDPLDGNTLLINAENGSLFAASYPDFTPRLMGNLDGGVMQVIWVP